jgi:hypothetical protein
VSAELAAGQLINVVQGERSVHGAFSSTDMALKPQRLSAYLSNRRNALMPSTRGSGRRRTTNTGRLGAVLTALPE